MITDRPSGRKKIAPGTAEGFVHGSGSADSSISTDRVWKEPAKARLFKVPVGCQRSSLRSHQEETDRVAE